MIGRKIKLNNNLKNEIIKLIRTGIFVKTACQILDIGETTFYKWMEKGRKGMEPYREFRESIKKARAAAEIRHVEQIFEASFTNWKASAWWLERTCPDRWGKRRKYNSFSSDSLTRCPYSKDRVELKKQLAERLEEIQKRLKSKSDRQKAS